MQFYPFGLKNTAEEGSPDVLGGKGAGLVWLATQGVSVPPGFIIPTSVWAEYDQKPKTTLKAIAKALPGYLDLLEGHFGYVPLLSVRSGARVSCPGMMDTILNVGIDADSIAEWTQRLGPSCFGDSFKRLVTMYGGVVKGLRRESFGKTLKSALDAYTEQTGEAFPTAKAQLLNSIEAVFKSWDNDRADFYRKQEHIPREWGTAVTVQAMVFGNQNDQSGTGVLFTRNTNTGAGLVTGEFTVNAQGEDIVAGLKTPQPLDAMKEWNPAVHDQLLKQVIGLENLKKDVLDIEFTVQDGTLYLLQVRTAKRTPLAAIKIATDLAKQGLITNTEAIQRVSIAQFDDAQRASLDPTWTKKPAFVGISACSGVVVGKPVFSQEDAINCPEPCILVREETTPDDIAGMTAAVGVVTMKGGATSHAAIVARGMNRACIVGVEQSVESFKDVEVLSLDGATGRIWTEAVPVVGGVVNGEIREFNQLVCSTLNVTPVIFDVPSYPMAEALLYLGDRVFHPAQAVQTVVQTLAKVDRLYLDLVPSVGEQPYLKILAAFNPIQQVLTRLQDAVPVDHESFDRLVVIADATQASPFARIVPGTDLRSIVLSDKEVTLDGVDMTDPAIQRVLNWKYAEGLSVVSIGKYSDFKGVKSMISIPQALQVIGNGKVV